MLNLAEYRRQTIGLYDYMPWACLVGPGIVLNKDGSFQRTLRYRGPDLDSATEAELVSVSARLNNVLKRFGAGWALFFEAERVPANQYPGARFADPAAWLVDQERYATFSADGAHHESRYFLTFLYLPPPEHEGRAERFLYERTDDTDLEPEPQAQLAHFVTETERALQMLANILPEAEALDDAGTLAYLHGTISDKRHPVAVPAIPTHLDAILCDTPFLGGVEPKLGSQHLRALTVLGFPNATTPGILDALNDLGFAYRWSTRWIAIDKTEATRQLTRLRRQWFAKRKSVSVILREVMFNRETALVDPDADNKAADADEALQELGQDDVAFGFLTTTVIVGDADPKLAGDKLLAIERIINGRGFVTIRETLNAVEAWLGSLPGNPYANVRQPIVHSLNLAHMMPVSAVWAGPESNRHLNAPTLDDDGDARQHAVPARSARRRCRTRADGRSDRCRQVGAAGVAGLAVPPLHRRAGRAVRSRPLGAGGSARHGWRKHRARAGRHAVPAAAGAHRRARRNRLRPAMDHGAADGGRRTRHAGREGCRVDRPAQPRLGAESRSARSPASPCSSNPTPWWRRLTPYTLEGAYGRLLDGASEALATTDVLHFEMEHLMQHKALIAPVLTYLFHRLEARFDGRPTLLILDEAWTFLDDAIFAARIREWLKTLRKKNVAVVFATQSLADIERSSIAPALIESCPTRIFLPNDRALEPQARSVYERFGLNARQIEILSLAAPKRDYYAQTARGNRLFELGLGPVALALCGASSPDDQRLIDRCIAGGTATGFAARFLDAKGLAWAAELIGRWHSRPCHRLFHLPPDRSGRRCAQQPPQPLPGTTPSPKAAAPTVEPRTDAAPLPGLPGGPPMSERLSPFRVAPGKAKRSGA